MPLQWQTVHVFISSTFNDMHAERDFLVKRVFPELRDWCEVRKLRLIDIDLRWGVTENDASSKRAVRVCLERINDCRPFFLCFLAQRHGWAPGLQGISPDTFESFPDLREAVHPMASVTELEIRHAILRPFASREPGDPERLIEHHPAEHAFFFFREPGYLEELEGAPEQLLCLFSDGVAPDGETDAERRQRESSREALGKLRREVEEGAPREPIHYSARWRGDLRTPELAMPLDCPFQDEGGKRRWQSTWNRFAQVGLGDAELNIPEEKRALARQYNDALTRGRLCDFRSQKGSRQFPPGTELSQIIQHDLREAILNRFPDRRDIPPITDLQREIDQQEGFIAHSIEGFIHREQDFVELDQYVTDDSDQMFVLTGPGGMGKSTLLAKWVHRFLNSLPGGPGPSLHFRFIGASDRSTTVPSLLRSVAREISEAAQLLVEIPEDPSGLRRAFRQVLEEAGRQGEMVLVLDALNQLDTGLSDLSWLPDPLPENVKIIVSVKDAPGESEALLRRWRPDPRVRMVSVRPFTEIEDRRSLVRAFLSQYLKELDEPLIERLVAAEGADNPLYLKIVLSELRVFGVFAALKEEIGRAFGASPESAFEAVLERLESDPAYSPLEARDAVPLFFGLLSHCRGGLAIDELVDLFVSHYPWQERAADQEGPSPDEFAHRREEMAHDAIHLYLRQVRPFMAHREGQHDFFYESFATAAAQRYAGEPDDAVPGRRPAQEWHRRLLRHLEARGENDQRTLRDLVFHLVGADDTDGLKNCFESGFLSQKKQAGRPADEIQSDLLLALSYFRDRQDTAGMFLVTTSSRLGGGETHLFTHESYLIWLGSVLATEDDEVEILRTITYIEKQHAGPDRLRLVAELLIGLGPHPCSRAFLHRHRHSLELALEEDEENGLGLLAAEALGRIDDAFSLALGPVTNPQRLCRILKLIRRLPDHQDAPGLFSHALNEAKEKLADEAHSGTIGAAGFFGDTVEGLGVQAELADQLAVDGSMPGGVAGEALSLVTYLADRPSMLIPLMDQVARSTQDPDRVALGLLYLGWFLPRLEQHSLVARVVAKRGKRKRPPDGFSPWRSAVLLAHVPDLKEIREGEDLAHEALLVPLCALWARLLEEDDGESGAGIEEWELEDLDPLVPPYDRAFKTDVASGGVWIELGQSLSIQGKSAASKRLLKRFRTLVETEFTPGTLWSDFLWFEAHIAFLLLLVFLYALVFKRHWMDPVVLVLTAALVAFLALVWFVEKWVSFLLTLGKQVRIRRGAMLHRPASPWLIRYFQRPFGDWARSWLVETGAWQPAAVTLLHAGREDLALKTVLAAELSPEAFLEKLRPGRWRHPEEQTFFGTVLRRLVQAREDPDTELWLDFAHELEVMYEHTTLPVGGLKLVAAGALRLGTLIRFVERFLGGKRIQLETGLKIDRLGETISAIADEDRFLEACRAARRLELADPHRISAVLLQSALLRSRRTYVESLRALSRWPGLNTRSTRVELRRDYVSMVRQAYNIPRLLRRAFLFPVLRFFYAGPDLLRARQKVMEVLTGRWVSKEES